MDKISAPERYAQNMIDRDDLSLIRNEEMKVEKEVKQIDEKLRHIVSDNYDDYLKSWSSLTVLNKRLSSIDNDLLSLLSSVDGMVQFHEKSTEHLTTIQEKIFLNRVTKIATSLPSSTKSCCALNSIDAKSCFADLESMQRGDRQFSKERQLYISSAVILIALDTLTRQHCLSLSNLLENLISSAFGDKENLPDHSQVLHKMVTFSHIDGPLLINSFIQKANELVSSTPLPVSSGAVVSSDVTVMMLGGSSNNRATNVDPPQSARNGVLVAACAIRLLEFLIIRLEELADASCEKISLNESHQNEEVVHYSCLEISKSVSLCTLMETIPFGWSQFIKKTVLSSSTFFSASKEKEEENTNESFDFSSSIFTILSALVQRSLLSAKKLQAAIHRQTVISVTVQLTQPSSLLSNSLSRPSHPSGNEMHSATREKECLFILEWYLSSLATIWGCLDVGTIPHNPHTTTTNERKSSANSSAPAASCCCHSCLLSVFGLSSATEEESDEEQKRMRACPSSFAFMSAILLQNSQTRQEESDEKRRLMGAVLFASQDLKKETTYRQIENSLRKVFRTRSVDFAIDSALSRLRLEKLVHDGMDGEDADSHNAMFLNEKSSPFDQDGLGFSSSSAKRADEQTAEQEKEEQKEVVSEILQLFDQLMSNSANNDSPCPSPLQVKLNSSVLISNTNNTANISDNTEICSNAMQVLSQAPLISSSISSNSTERAAFGAVDCVCCSMCHSMIDAKRVAQHLPKLQISASSYNLPLLLCSSCQVISNSSNKTATSSYSSSCVLAPPSFVSSSSPSTMLLEQWSARSWWEMASCFAASAHFVGNSSAVKAKNSESSIEKGNNTERTNVATSNTIVGSASQCLSRLTSLRKNILEMLRYKLITICYLRQIFLKNCLEILYDNLSESINLFEFSKSESLIFSVLKFSKLTTFGLESNEILGLLLHLFERTHGGMSTFLDKNIDLLKKAK